MMLRLITAQYSNLSTKCAGNGETCWYMFVLVIKRIMDKCDYVIMLYNYFDADVMLYVFSDDYSLGVFLSYVISHLQLLSGGSSCISFPAEEGVPAP